MSEPDTEPPASPDSSGPILLFDGVCSFCNGTVQFILRRDRNGTMRFAPIGGSTWDRIAERHPEVRGVDSLILVRSPGTEQESVAIRSDAVLGIAAYLGGLWRAWLLGRFVPRPLRDLAYAAFARVRYRLFGRYDTCPLPSPDVRARFLP